MLHLSISIKSQSTTFLHFVFSDGEKEGLPRSFLAKEGQMRIVEKKDRIDLFFAVGKQAELTAAKMRILAGNCYKQLQSEGIQELDVPLLEGRSDLFYAMAEGFFLTSYRFDEWKTEKEALLPEVKSIHFIGHVDNGSEILEKVIATGSGVFFARSLVDGNASMVSPDYLAERACALAAAHKSLFSCQVLSKKELEACKAGLILGVAQGSKQEPKMIFLRYKNNPDSDAYLVLAGKGVTYDTGGHNLKPTGSMEAMKCDMAGAAAVLGCAEALSKKPLPVNVIFAVGATYNMIGPDAILPGDVITSYRGLTVEITNTDAEGRLVLADLLAYVEDHYKVEASIDIATLTGAAELAFGREFAPFYARDVRMEERLKRASIEVDEALWPMPLHPNYDSLLRSSIADLVNSPKQRGGSINAAASFIGRFVKTKPWAHLDIAGVAFGSEPRRSYQTSESTGFGVRLFYQLLEQWSPL